MGQGRYIHVRGWLAGKILGIISCRGVVSRGRARKLPMMAVEESGNDGLSSKAVVDDGGYPGSWTYTR